MMSPMEKAQLDDHERRLRIIEGTLKLSEPPDEPAATVAGPLTSVSQMTEAELQAQAEQTEQTEEAEQAPAEDDALEDLEDVDEQ
jgi:hypothetical protein